MTAALTIYDFAQKEMGAIVNALLELAEASGNFLRPTKAEWENSNSTEMLLCGKGYHVDDIPNLPSAEK